MRNEGWNIEPVDYEFLMACLKACQLFFRIPFHSKMIIAQASSRIRSLKTRKFSSQVTQTEWKFERFSWLKNFWGESRCKWKSVNNGSENKCFSLNWIPSRFTWTASEIEYFFNEKNKRLKHKEAFVWCSKRFKWTGNTSKL